jgi:hypothetical protein
MALVVALAHFKGVIIETVDDNTDEDGEESKEEVKSELLVIDWKVAHSISHRIL